MKEAIWWRTGAIMAALMVFAATFDHQIRSAILALSLVALAALICYLTVAFTSGHNDRVATIVKERSRV